MTLVDQESSAMMCNTKTGLVPGKIGRRVQQQRRPSSTVSGGTDISFASEPLTMLAMARPGRRDLIPGRVCGEEINEIEQISMGNPEKVYLERNSSDFGNRRPVAVRSSTSTNFRIEKRK